MARIIDMSQPTNVNLSDGICAHRVFSSYYAFFERPSVARRALLALLIIHTVLLAYSAYVHSPTLNEPAHLAAGLSHWKFGRFELYRVNPPLVRMVAALPVIISGYNEDWGNFYESPGARPEMELGQAFVRANGPRSAFLFMIARWACIPFSWLGAIVCYLWARDLYGRPAGLLAATFWSLEPNILAHAGLITPDVPATALGLAACYTFRRWLNQPTWMQAAITGVVLGLAELAKTTLIVFYPLWPLLWLVFRWPDRSFLSVRDWTREAAMLMLRMLIGLYILNLGYGFEGSFTRLNNYRFVSNLFSGRTVIPPAFQQTDAAGKNHAVPVPLGARQPMNRFGDSWLGHLPLPFPRNYVAGLDIQQIDFESYARHSYLRGDWREHGWWYYYLYACVIKMPLGLLALIPFAFVGRASAFYSSGGRSGLRRKREELILLLPGIVIFVVVSSKTGFSEHLRYVLPSFSYFFIWISQSAQLLATKRRSQ